MIRFYLRYQPISKQIADEWQIYTIRTDNVFSKHRTKNDLISHEAIDIFNK